MKMYTFKIMLPPKFFISLIFLFGFISPSCLAFNLQRFRAEQAPKPPAQPKEFSPDKPPTTHRTLRESTDAYALSSAIQSVTRNFLNLTGDTHSAEASTSTSGVVIPQTSEYNSNRTDIAQIDSADAPSAEPTAVSILRETVDAAEKFFEVAEEFLENKDLSSTRSSTIQELEAGAAAVEQAAESRWSSGAEDPSTVKTATSSTTKTKTSKFSQVVKRGRTRQQQARNREDGEDSGESSEVGTSRESGTRSSPRKARTLVEKPKKYYPDAICHLENLSDPEARDTFDFSDEDFERFFNSGVLEDYLFQYRLEASDVCLFWKKI